MFLKMHVLFVLIVMMLILKVTAYGEEEQPYFFKYDQPVVVNKEQPAIINEEQPQAVNEEVPPAVSVPQPVMVNSKSKEPSMNVEVPPTAADVGIDNQNIQANHQSVPAAVTAPNSKTLDDCFAALQKKMSPEELEGFKKKTESQLGEYQASLGAWISDNWVKPSGSPLREYFNDLGVYRPEDISKIVLISFHQRLNNKEIPIEQQIKNLNNNPKDAQVEEPSKDKKGKSAGKKNKRSRN